MAIHGTVAELAPIAKKVLLWVANERKWADEGDRASDDTLRRIELCAQVVLEMTMFHELYGGGTYEHTDTST